MITLRDSKGRKFEVYGDGNWSTPVFTISQLKDRLEKEEVTAWYFDSHHGECGVVSPFDWKVKRGSFSSSNFVLQDPYGEQRNLEWDLAAQIVALPDWAEWDKKETLRLELEKSKREAEELAHIITEGEFGRRAKNALQDIRAVNEIGGPGSRKKVREIIDSLI